MEDGTGEAHTQVRVYRDGRLVDDHCAISAISDHLATAGGLIWIDLLDPNPAVLHELAEELGLHELAVEDALSARQRPKLDEYDNHLFLSFRAVRLNVADGELTEGARVELDRKTGHVGIFVPLRDDEGAVIGEEDSTP